MATSSDDYDYSENYLQMVKQLSSITNCAICSKPFSKPKLLTCGHIFCISCLEKIFKKSGCKPTACPTCKTSFYPEDGDVNKLPPVPFINELLCLIKTQDTEEYCSVCDDKLATFMCTDCNKQMCDECSLLHEKFYKKDSHTILQKSKIKDTSVLAILAGKTSNTICDIHKGKVMEYLCTTCNCLICNDCTYTEHQSHKKQTLSKAANETRCYIKDMEADIIEQIEHKRKKQQALKQLSFVNNKHKAEVEEKIKLFFKDMVSIMFQKEKELIQKLREICAKNDALVKKSSDKCDSQTVMEESLLQYIRNLDEHGDDTQLVKERIEIKRRFQQLKRQQEEIEIPDEETFYVDFHVSHNALKDIQEMVFGKVVCNTTSDSDAQDEYEDSTCIVQEVYDDVVVSKGNEKETVSCEPNISFTIPPPLPPKPSFSLGIRHSATMPDLREDEYQPLIRNSPTSSERDLYDHEYELCSDDYTEAAIYSECGPAPKCLFQAQVKVSGFDISQSGEISIVSNCSKACLVFDCNGTRKHVIEENLKDPWDVAAGRRLRNGVDVIYISDSGKGKSDGTVREMTYTGMHLRNIGPTKMKAPRGVCISRLGNIYVCDAESHCILVLCSDTGKTIKRIEQNSGGLPLFKQPTYISVCPNMECYVTDKITHDVIILNESGDRKNTYTGRYRFGDAEDNYRIYDIQFNPAMSCSDKRNNVYIIDMTSHCLHILLFDGNVKEIDIKPEYYSPSPKSPPVALAFDSNQELWIATESGAVFLFPTSDLQQKLAESCRESADYQKVAMRK